MSCLLYGLMRVDRHQLSEQDKALINTNIGMLAGMTGSVAEALVNLDLHEQDRQDLSYTAALLAEIIGELSGLLQA